MSHSGVLTASLRDSFIHDYDLLSKSLLFISSWDLDKTIDITLISAQ